MAKVQENFIRGRMNKSVDERLLPDGEYIDAQNVRLGSTEESEIGSVENAKGNFEITRDTILYNGQGLSSQASTIGAVADGIHETIYWFVHDPEFSIGATGKLDMILSYNTNKNQLTYHVVSIDDGGGQNTTLNFSRNYLVTGVDVLDDLLFFTDGLNPPRKINISRNYPDPDSVLNVDGISAEELMVIKKPPIASPAIEVKTTATDNNFMEERFVCFGYRYKYEDNEYSATSQFSEPAFVPKNFNFNTNTYLNDGMVNLGNECVITYNTGGRLVQEVELLFKEMGDSTIKVIEKLEKEALGLADDTDYTFSFDNSKIYTILDDAEILRLYDNVPHTAVAQTIMGNRLMYGNYADGYDIVDAGGNKVKLEYSANLISEEVGEEVIADGAGSNTESSNYTYGATVTVDGSQFFIDLADINLKKGAVLSFYLRFDHSRFEGDTTPTETTSNQEITIDYILKKDFANAYELATDPDFIQNIGAVNLLTSGTNTSVTATSLVDSGATFVTDGVKDGSLVTNTSTNTSTTVASVVSETQLTLLDDIFTAIPENYSIYTSTSIRSVEDACEGFSLTDTFNCTIPNNLDSLTKIESGIASAPQPIEIKTSSSSSIIRFQLPAVRFVDNVSTPTQNAYEYYEINDLLVDYREIGNPTSLHSNRDYQIGIIYMDEFNRASTALVSTNNTVHVPCSASDLRNQIQVTIPTQQIAPSWATRYKFAIKSDRERYDTIYSNIYYEDVTDNSVYFLLEGENARKVEVGDRYYVKADTEGAVNNCVLATVLEKEAKPSDFLSPAPQDTDGNDLVVLGGVYMKMKPDNFTAIFDPDAVVAPGVESDTEKWQTYSPIVIYPANIETSTAGEYEDYNIPANSRVKLRFETLRKGKNNGRYKKIEYKSEVNIIASADYSNLKQFFDSENIAGALNAAAFVDTDSLCADGVKIEYIDTLLEQANGEVPKDIFPPNVNGVECTLYAQFYRYNPTGSDDGRLSLLFTGTTSGGNTQKRKSKAVVEIEVVRAESTVVFETEPQETAPDVWYESSDSFPITTNGYHEGNVQNQTAGQAGIVTTDFFNCISFGNGVESSKIYDSLTGKSLFLGNRITTVANQDFKRAERYSDITYSGVYNDEANINKLNSFNLGQLNFKVLEDTYGPVMVMSGRRTDVLVLQEDKISYVLAGKNLISDSSAGGAIASVPEVLGTQIARVEEYGISHNPESYTEWGAMKYFTDAKRGAVIQLFGSTSENEQLSVISSAGMRSWFRDMFIDEFNTQKLGAYDPYMGEYVLATTNTTIPQPVDILSCGVTKTYDVFQGSDVGFTVNVGKTVGDVVIDYNIIAAAGDVKVNATYNGVVVSSGFVSASGSITVDKDTVSKDTLDINMVSNNGLAVVELKVNCPDAAQITIFEVAITSNGNEGEFITNQYRWTDGDFVSPLHSERMSFGSGTDVPVVSKYDAVTGPQGAGIIPANGASVDIMSKRIDPVDNYQFDVAVDKFFFLRSDTLYANNTTEINALLAAATEVTPSAVDANTFSGSFTMPDTTGQYLYIIYDYRNGNAQELCYGTSRFDVCCNCS